MTDQPDPTGQPDPEEPQGTTDVTQVRIRRAPKIAVFIILGAGLGAVIAFVLTALFPVDPDVGFGPLFGIPAGAVVGAVIAIVLDRVSTRRAKTITAEHTTVEPLPIEGETPED